MMKARGHYIIHYGHEDSDVICDEHVTVSTNKDLEIAYGNYDWRNGFFKFDVQDHAYQTFFKNAIEEVGKRKQPRDFILPFWGSGVRPICDAHQDLICVEPGIGYAGGHWARWKIFESYAIYHAYGNMTSCGTCKQDWYEAVIPNYFDLNDFDYCEEKEDYFLFLGRVYEGKGIHIAIQLTAAIGVRLVVAGQQSLKENGYDPLPSHVTEIGYADRDTRKRLMSKAKCGIVASMYVEPFGGVQMEMLLSGTPTITTDWGSFTENNIHGVTGYRCRTFDQFCWAGRNIDKIRPADCRKWAMNFSLEKVSLMYEEYFQMVLDVQDGPGWYQKHPERESLGWLHKTLAITGPEPAVAKKPKIAIFSETKWAFGRIHNAIIKYMKQWFDFEYFDWQNSEHCERLFKKEEWKNFDIILGNTVITYSPSDKGWFPYPIPLQYLSKCVAVSHTPILNHPTFCENIISKLPLFCGISQEVIDVMVGVKANLTPIGVDLKHFYPTREITTIKRAGIIGNPEWPNDVKRLDMFKLICEKANLEPVFIHGKDWELHNKIYEDVDLFMYTSTFEGAGLGILEAGACNIPVITTKVGYSLYLKNIKTFDTVDEAVILIEWLGEGNNIKEYTEKLSEEIRRDWNWETICKNFWKPVFEKKIKLVEKVYYINLKKRDDRKQAIEKELLLTGLDYERFDAIEEDPGYVGCTKSHIEVLKLAKKNHLKNVLILEDDFTFSNLPNKLKDKLVEFFNLGFDYDVLLLSYNLISGDGDHHLVGKVLDAQTTSGYLVNEKYYDILLKNFEEGLVFLEKYNSTQVFSIDMYWKKLQVQDNWYYFKERIGYQKSGYSDICKCEVNYGV
jgi:glycosyltransferase involved in cell wall biosynthesis